MAVTPNIGLQIYSEADYHTFFKTFWQTVNGVGNDSGFVKIDAAYKALSDRVDNLEITIASEFTDLLEEAY